MNPKLDRCLRLNWFQNTALPGPNTVPEWKWRNGSTAIGRIKAGYGWRACGWRLDTLGIVQGWGSSKDQRHSLTFLTYPHHHTTCSHLPEAILEELKMSVAMVHSTTGARIMQHEHRCVLRIREPRGCAPEQHIFVSLTWSLEPCQFGNEAPHYINKKPG